MCVCVWNSLWKSNKLCIEIFRILSSFLVYIVHPAYRRETLQWYFSRYFRVLLQNSTVHMCHLTHVHIYLDVLGCVWNASASLKNKLNPHLSSLKYLFPVYYCNWSDQTTLGRICYSRKKMSMLLRIYISNLMYLFLNG